MALTFYTHPMSRGRMVRWMLEEVGEPYEARVLDFGPPMKGGAYRAVNPMGKVPTLVHRGRVVTEAAAICAYLADAFPEAGLLPDDEERADYWRWLFFAAGPVEHAVTNRHFGVSTEGKEMMAGDSIIMPIAISTDDTTRSMIRKGMNSMQPIWKALFNSDRTKAASMTVKARSIGGVAAGSPARWAI